MAGRTTHIARWRHHDPSPEAVAANFGPTADGLKAAQDDVAFHGGQPIGLVQFARFVDYPDDLAELEGVYPVNVATATIDYLIGDPTKVGRGLGTSMIATFVECILDRHRDIDHPSYR